MREENLRHEFVETHEFENPLYVVNQADRCYHCKTELFGVLEKLRAARGFGAVTYGVNADDMKDFRPGHRAASEFGVVAPLLDVGLTQGGNPRAVAPRGPRDVGSAGVGVPVVARSVRDAGDGGKSVAHRTGGKRFARIMAFAKFGCARTGNSLGLKSQLDELPRALQGEMAEALAERIREIGFTHVTLDPEGYRQGSLNAALKKK